MSIPHFFTRTNRFMAISIFLLLIGVALSLGLILSASPATLPKAAPDLAQLPLYFIPRAEPEEYGAGSGVQLSASGLSLAVPRFTDDHSIEMMRVHSQFIGANPITNLEPDTTLPAHVNELQGSDASQWRLRVPIYGGLTYHDLYPSVDLRYSGTEGQLKGTYTVAPGADPSLIRWQYDEAATVAVDRTTGDLKIAVDGEVALVEQAPVAWQDIDGQRVPVSVAYTVTADGMIGFSLGLYDATRPLIIDPTIAYETVFSAGFLDVGYDITVDTNGRAWVVAYTLAEQDAVVIKLDTDGTVLFATYLQGSGIDEGNSIKVDDQGNAIVFGRTLSNDFPVLNAIQPTLNGFSDTFVTKLAAADGSLMFSTYLGGGTAERGYGLALNEAGNIFLTGATDSTDYPTVNPIQDSLNLTYCFCFDAFVSVLSSDGSTLLYSTYYGGGFDDFGWDIGVDAADNIYFAGETESFDFPTANALQPTFGGGDQDVFVARFSADGSTVDYSTFLGGEEIERVRGIDVDPVGYAHIGGSTNSAGFPTTAGAFQPNFAGGINACGNPPFDPIRNCYDAFASKIVPDGSAFAFSTFLGGDDDEEGNALARSGIDGSIYLAGYTYSDDFPGGTGLLFISRLDSTGSSLVYTFLPTVNSAAGHGAAVDSVGDVYVTGSNNVPADVYVIKLFEDIVMPTPTATMTPSPTPTLTPTATATPSPEPDPQPVIYLPYIQIEP